jgi:RimJ/RimL family protein N-acetyltransferase
MIFPDVLPKLVTERLVLRGLAEPDVQALFALFSDPEVMRYWSTSPMKKMAEAQALLDRGTAAFSQRTSLRWGIQPQAGAQIIGTCVLFHLDEQNSRAEIGYALDRTYWGQGLMGEALTAVLTYGFDERCLNLKRVEADLDPRNSASARTLERLGFTREGLLRERWIVAGETSDSLIMGLLRREWQVRPGTG